MYDNSNNVELTLKKKLFQIFIGTIFFLLAIFIALSSITFNFNETGWRVVSNIEPKNFLEYLDRIHQVFFLKNLEF